ncbi:MAG TPA: hypothetical protein VK574_12950 [Terracidiphilus sp.]|nr:hypothetical protein [Terracidiphilus sp.]
MSTLNLKPANAPVRAYYATLQKFAKGRFDNEGNIRGAFEDLLKKCAGCPIHRAVPSRDG